MTALEFLKNAHGQDRLVHAYIFEGRTTCDKWHVVKTFAKLLLCESNASCGSCQTCQNIAQDQSENMFVVNPEGKSIKKENILALKTEMTKTSLGNKAKIYVIEQAEKMTVSAANSLLKFLEEPAPNHYILLLTQRKENLLPTIVSRAVALSLVEADTVAEFDEALLSVLAETSHSQQIPSVVLAKHQKTLKEPGAVLEFLELYQSFYREMLDVLLNKQTGLDRWGGLLDEAASRLALSEVLKRIKVILEAKKRLEFNANAMLVMEWMFDEFGRS